MATSISGLGKGSNKGLPAPLRCVWADDDRLPVVEVEESLLGSVANLQALIDLVAKLASSAPPRVVLAPASQVQLLRALQPLLHGATAAQAAQLLAAYSKLGIPIAEYVTTAADASAVPASSDSSSTSSGTSTTSSSSNSNNTASSSGSGAVGPNDGTAPWRTASDALVACVLKELVHGQAGALLAANADQLSSLLWAMSELERVPWDAGSLAPSATAADGSGGWFGAFQRALLARVQGQDFLAPSLARAVCGIGALVAESRAAAAQAQSVPCLEPLPPLQALAQAQAVDSSTMASAGPVRVRPVLQPSAALTKALAEEVRYQLTEFGSDFSPEDLARVCSGMADLRMLRYVDEEFRRLLMKAVYGRTRSIADKAAVDFALKRLFDGDEEARSMHYDTRWTHEELHWLPRRERDKRRIMQQAWLDQGRTQWGGWAQGRA